MGKKRVMMVDDEEDFLTITKINLEQTGKYEVMTLSNAKDIISQVKNFNPDVILIDILMPKINGIKTCGMLNDDPIGKKVPIIVLSALDTDKDKLIMHKLGTVVFLVKPLESSKLIVVIEKVLAGNTKNG